MTRKEYFEYVKTVLEFLKPYERHVKPGSMLELKSVKPCECCHSSKEGYRWRATFTKRTGIKETHTLNVCSDCGYFLEYGRLTDDVMKEVFEDDSEEVLNES